MRQLISIHYISYMECLCCPFSDCYISIREKPFREMKKDVGMTKGWKWDQSLFCISSQQFLHICTLLHYNLKLPDVYVRIVGWIYRTKIDPISILLVSLLF